MITEEMGKVTEDAEMIWFTTEKNGFQGKKSQLGIQGKSIS